MAKKTYKKRLKITKNGKILRRQKGLGHARAKKSGTTMMKKKGVARISKADKSNIIQNKNR